MLRIFAFSTLLTQRLIRAVLSSSYKSFSTVQLVGFSGRDAAQKLQLIPRPPACAVIVLQGMLHRAVYDYRYVRLSELAGLL